MRIISGNFRGKKIFDPKDENTRPLKDLTKESIFNIIEHSNKFNVQMSKSNVLDLFSGTGSFGLECLSRNALFVTFVEAYKEVLPILQRNIDNLNNIKNYEVIKKDIFDNVDFNSFDIKFDIIFLDPPYKERKLNQLLTKIFNASILNNNGIIIIHRHKKEKNEYPETFNIIEEKNYGISKIIFGSYI